MNAQASIGADAAGSVSQPVCGKRARVEATGGDSNELKMNISAGQHAAFIKSLCAGVLVESAPVAKRAREVLAAPSTAPKSGLRCGHPTCAGKADFANATGLKRHIAAHNGRTLLRLKRRLH